MKFLYSHRTQSADGQYVHISELTTALRARGHEIVMAGPGGDGVRPLSAAPRASVGAILPPLLYEFAERAYSAVSYRRLTRAIEEQAPQLIYERYNLHHHAGAAAARRFCLPLMLEVNAPLAAERSAHGNLHWRAFARRSERRIWNAADRVLPVTGALAQRVCAAGVPAERICVIQNGVNDAFLERHDGEALRARYGLHGKTILGFAGFVRDWHGLDRVIRFLAASENPDAHLLIVGEGPASAGLKALARETGVADRVTFAGVVQRDAVPAYISAFDIALQPAVVDYASPLKLFEYMALARAIIAPACENIREVLADDVDALLFSEENGAFERALMQLIAKPDQRARLGAAARESLIRQDLTWAGNARRIEKIAEQLLKERHDRASGN